MRLYAMAGNKNRYSGQICRSAVAMVRRLRGSAGDLCICVAPFCRSRQVADWLNGSCGFIIK